LHVKNEELTPPQELLSFVEDVNKAPLITGIIQNSKINIFPCYNIDLTKKNI